MADAHAKHHDYHLVDPSPWPAVGATSAFITAIGAVMYFHDAGSWLLVLGLIGIVFTMFVWWRDVINEAQVTKDHTPVVQLHLRYGMIMFIASEVMFFVAWFWAYFDVALFPGSVKEIAEGGGQMIGMVERNEVTGGQWPPEGIVTFDPWELPLVNTLILLTSGTTITWAHHALLNNDRKGLIWGLFITIILGILFTATQAFEYSHAEFKFADNIYGSTFYMATGFHGFHVIVGTICLTVMLFRAMAGHFTPKQHFGFEAAAWYWHFVDVVWLFLFACIYVWGAGAKETLVGT